MESIQAIKGRIQSIQSTRQITQSMRLVSTSKVQRSRARMEANAPYLKEAAGLIDSIISALSSERHPMLDGNGSGVSAVIAIASDRGLCGGYNINAGREAAELIDRLENPRIVTAGVKMRDFLRRRHRGKIAASFTGVSENPFFDDAAAISSIITGWYASGEIGEAYLVYTAFESMLSQSPSVKRLLPLECKAQAGHVSLDPGGAEILDDAVPFYLSSVIYGALLESSLCEQSARISSMDAAVKSSDEMISSLTIRYNQARQSAITQEITEIVAGADAVV